MSYYLYFQSKLAFTRYKYRLFSSLASLAQILGNYYYIFPTEQTDEMVPAFNSTTFSKILSVLFGVSALDSLINYYFLWSPSIPAVLRTKSILYRSWFVFLKNLLSLYSFPTFYGRALKAYYLQLSTGTTEGGPSRHNWKIINWKFKEFIQTK